MRMNLKNWMVMLIFLLVVASITSAGQIIYVDADATVGGDGSSWAAAFKILQDALDDAASGDEIWVAEGTYMPDTNSTNPSGSGSRDATFQLQNGVTLRGGYAGFGEPDPDARDIELYETILSGDLAGDDGPNFANNGENSYHVVTGTDAHETAVLDGFTITAGNANNSSSPNNSGGGIYNGVGNMTLTNCTIADNYAAGAYLLAGGGGIYHYKGNMTLTNCTIIANSAYHGGGIFNCYGNMTLTDCAFIGNSAPYDGGGFSIDYYSVTLANCMFIGNSAGRRGGGLFNSHFGSAVSNCTFIDNTAGMGGGVGSYWLYLNSLTLTNCTFIGNSADDLGGAVSNIHTDEDKYVKLTNCILWDNSAWDGPQVGMEQSGNLYISYSCLKGGELDVYAPEATLFWDESNIGGDLVNDNPLFVTGQLGDYYLSQVVAGEGANSPCVDAGSDTAAKLGLKNKTTRIDKRGDTGTVDMGYHYPKIVLPNSP